jgi:hypothetical protein
VQRQGICIQYSDKKFRKKEHSFFTDGLVVPAEALYLADY